MPDTDTITTGQRVQHADHGRYGTVLEVIESTSPYNPGTWIMVDFDGMPALTPATSVLAAARRAA